MTEAEETDLETVEQQGSKGAGDVPQSTKKAHGATLNPLRGFGRDIQRSHLQRMLSHVGDMGLRRRVRTILRYLDLKDDDTVLDCGCGEGFYLEIISRLYNCRLYGLDLDRKLLARARERLGERSGVTLLQGDATRLPFPDESFAKVIASELLEHVPDDLQAIREIRRVLKTGGIVAITVPNHNYPFFWDPLNKTREALGLGHFSKEKGLLGGIWAMHLRLYYPAEIQRLVQEAALSVEEMEGLTHRCLPFNHNILYFFKQIVFERVPLPASIHASLDKFAWDQDGTSPFNPIPLFQKVLDIVDKPNDDFHSLDKSSMCIALKARK
ncbi:MAG: class I SAM-dependent methyltransferase [Chloroflexi bacterium]|nr:class I SAM-dependent methyltransferase [Chloroflexota bacterium]